MGFFIYHSPWGDLEIGTSDTHIFMIDWISNPRHSRILNDVGPYITSNTPDALKNLVLKELDAYFTGQLTCFSIPFMITGTTFRKRVFEELNKVNYGAVKSYKELAENIGTTKSIRAVASAVARNPLNIVIPCHRVIASDGSIGGYAGGIDTKSRLLRLEKILLK